MSMAIQRLKSERKQFRKDRPFGFSAAPQKNGNGEMNLLVWNCKIPGKKNTNWESGIYSVQLIFPQSYPQIPPTARFTPPLFHVNIFADGRVCLSLLKESDWKPQISLKTILLNLQDFLSNPNILDPANGEASKLFKASKAKYEDRILRQSKQFAP